MKSLLRFSTELILPRFCVGCGYVGSYVCPSCENELKYSTRDICLYCKKSTPYGLTHPACRRRGGVDGLMTIFFYSPLLKKILKSIKYRLATEVFSEFITASKVDAWSKLAFYKRVAQNVTFTPVPLHPHRLRNRGFNQAELLVNFVSELTQSPKSTFLMRNKDTPSQSQLKHGLDRWHNMSRAFRVIDPKKVKGKTIVLVDDVVTTGATARQAAAALKRAGAQAVFVFALAKG